MHPSQQIATGLGRHGVKKAPIVTVVLGDIPTLEIGGTFQAAAQVFDALGRSHTDRVISWSSSAPAIATVSSFGFVTAVANGSATIQATCEGVSDSKPLTVQPNTTVATVGVSGTLTVLEGNTTQLSATAWNASNVEVLGKTFIWESSDPAIATVSSSGLVTGVLAGTVAITATTDNVSGTADVTVQAAAADTTPPAVPTGLSAGTPTTSSLPLTWNLHPNTDGDLAAIRVYYTTDGNAPNTSSAMVAFAAASTGGTLSSLPANTLIRVAISARDLTGNESTLSSAVSATTDPVPSGNFVTFNDTNLERVLGPLPTLTDGLTVTPTMPCPNYDAELIAAATTVANSWTRKYPRQNLTGTVSVIQGSGNVVGNGTLFTQELDNNSVYGITDSTGTQRRGYRVTVIDDTHLTISPTWAFADVAGAAHASDFGSLNVGANNANDGPRNYLMGYGNYYDFVSLCYMLYLRSGDAYWLTAFRELGEVWWRTWYYGGSATFSQISAPRNSAMLSMILRAKDLDAQGITHTSWDYLYHLLYKDQAGNISASTYFGTWLWLRKDYVPGVQGFGLYYGARDPGYALWYTLAFASLAPDTWLDTDGVTSRNGATIKAEMLNNAMIVMRDYICRAQYLDGSWRWEDGSGALDWGTFNQPFILGIFMEPVILAHRVCQTLPAWHAAGTNWDGSQSLLADIEDAIIRFADWLFGAAYCHYYPTNNTSLRWRSTSYAQFVDVAFYRYPNGTISIDPASPRTIVGSGTTFTETPEVNPTRVSKQPAIKPGAYICGAVVQTGTVACSGTNIITGTGTAFLSNPHLYAGRIIRVGSTPTSGMNDWRVVSVDSDTQLTISQNAGNFSGWSWALEFGTWLTGSVAISGSSNQLTGTGTLFTTELTPGQEIYIPQDVTGLYGDASRRYRKFTVASIQSDTLLTMTTAGTFTGSSFPVCLTKGAALTVASVDSDTQITTEQDYTGPSISGANCRLFCTYPATYNNDPSTWSDNRQNNTEWIHVYGYAYKLTGDQKYKTWGDEAFDACFARLGPGIYGSTGDSKYGWQKGFIGWYWGWRSKELNQAHRSTGRYLAWRAGA